MENSVLDLSNYNIIKRLNKDNEGQFKKIYLVESKETKEQFIAKVWKTEITTEIDQKHFLDEIKELNCAKHQTVLELKGFSLSDFKGKSFPTILTTFLPNGSLRNILDKEYQNIGDQNFTNTKKQICLFGIAIGMKYLHEINIIHRDIKPETILLDNNYYPKICDFGLSKITSSETNENGNGNIESPLYMAPEVFDGEYSEEGDAYSYAMVLYELYSKQIPAFDVKSIFKLVLAVREGKRPDLKLIESEEKRKFVNKCWSQDPGNRYAFKAIVNILIQKRELWLPDVDENEIDDYLSNFNYSILNLKRSDELLKKGKLFLFAKAYKEAILFFEQAIELGNYKAMTYLANMLTVGDGMEKNPQEGAKYFKQAADLGNSRAMFCYASMLHKGEGIQKNPQEAIKYYKQAIDLGNADAMHNYATMLQEGDGIEKNPKEAIKYYKQAIDLGNSNAMFYYACMLHHGNGIEKNPQEAIKYYKQAIALGNNNAMLNYGNMLHDGEGMAKNPKEAIKYYKQAADLGNSFAMMFYAGMLQNGEGVAKNPKEAMKYLKKAADLGDTDAMLFYGSILQNRSGTSKNIKEAIKYYKQAADLGNSNAMLHYADMLQKGDGVAKNPEEAKKYYLKAIENGNKDALSAYMNTLRG